MNKKTLVIGTIILVIIAAIVGLFFTLDQKQAAKPKTYSEIFKNPVDPNTEPQKHKTIYERVGKVVDFPIFYPKNMENGYKLAEIQAKKDLAFETKGDFIAFYENNNSKIKVVEGVADTGIVKSLEYLDFANQEAGKKAWLWEQGGKIGISLYYNSEVNYFFIGENTDKDKLIQFAKSFIPLK